MEPFVFYPEKKFQKKLYIGAVLVVVLALAWWVIPLGIAIGYDTNGDSGALLGFLLAMLFNGMILALAFWSIPHYYRSLRYEIHEDEVIVYVGIITRAVKHVPFRTVTNLKVTRDPIDRWFGIGSLSIQTAGMSGTSGAEEKLVGLVNVQGVYEQVAGELRRFRGAMTPTQAGEELALAHPPAPAGPADAGQQLLVAILDELRAIRAGLEQA